MLEIRQIMTTELHTARPQTPVLDAMKILVEQKISGLPVVDDEMRLVGMITEKDMLKLLLEDVITHRQIVRDYMSTNVQSLAPEDGVIKVCKLFMNTPFRRIPIVSQGKLIGIVSRSGILKLILEKNRE